MTSTRFNIINPIVDHFPNTASPCVFYYEHKSLTMTYFVQLSHQFLFYIRDDRKTADYQENPPSKPSALHICAETHTETHVSDMHGLDIQVCI